MFGERAVPSSSIFHAIQARAGIEGSIAEKHLGSGAKSWRLSGVAYTMILLLWKVSSRRRTGCPVSDHFTSSLMSVTVFGSGGICFLLALKSWLCCVEGVQPLDDFSGGVVPFVVSKFVEFFCENGRDGLYFICTSFGYLIHYLFCYNVCVVSRVGVGLSSESCEELLGWSIRLSFVEK